MKPLTVFRDSASVLAAFSSGRDSKILDNFPRRSVKKKLFHLYLRTKAFAGNCCGFGRKVPDFEVFDGVSFSQIISKLGLNLDFNSVDILYYRNREYGRRRAYIWIGGEEERSEGYFIKVGAGGENRKRLVSEGRVIELLDNEGVNFGYPKKYGVATIGEVTVAIYENIGIAHADVTAITWSDVDHALSELRQKYAKTLCVDDGGAEWFREFLSGRDSSYAELVTGKLRGGHLQVSFLHGDMGSENVYAINDRLYIVDWEWAGVNVPVLTDEVLFVLGNMYEAGGEEGMANYLLERFSGGRKNGLLPALLYGAHAKFPPAEDVLNYMLKQDKL